jgi:carbamoyltransferase
MAYFLGIFGGQGPNPSAALFKNGALIAMAEEERFNRIKNSPNAIPINAIKFCLDSENIKISEISEFGFGWECDSYYSNWPEFSRKIRKIYSSYDQSYDLNYEERIRTGFNPIRIKEDIKFGLAKLNLIFDTNKLKFYNHHECHAASTFFMSGFQEALVFSIDGSGEEITTSVWVGNKTDLKLVYKKNLPDTLGGFYATFTEFLGFKANSEEGKLMGLAPYGNYCQEIQNKLDKFISFNPSKMDFSINMEMRFIGVRTWNNLFTDKFVDLFGKPRAKNEELSQYHKDLAFNVQHKLETVIASMVSFFVNKFEIHNICLAGGVAMNCKMNGKLATLDNVKGIFVQPASSDNGISIGAGILAAKHHGIKDFVPLEHCYLGSEFTDEEIQAILSRAKLTYEKPEYLTKLIAKYLKDGLIIGWFQGKAEFGARALGNRSILANPLISDMRQKLNLQVKNRENWRPFCPSVTIESYEKYFGKSPINKFMILAFQVEEKYIDQIPAVVHIDGSARPQAVDKKSNPNFYSLLKEFENLTGHPILINTSFNVQGEPIVNSPQDAIRAFYSTGIDILVLGNFVLKKQNV